MNYEAIVYTNGTCSYCSGLREWLKEKKISFTDRNIENPELDNELEMFYAQGIPFIRMTNRGNVKEGRTLSFQPKKKERIHKNSYWKHLFKGVFIFLRAISETYDRLHRISLVLFFVISLYII